ncbi:MAG: hypothetical protein NTX79_06650 [Candidatus Micrarchaeota archaeon]|nr:hypothetical protein [Candidatus Micrarchaeota archaeon]
MYSAIINKPITREHLLTNLKMCLEHFVRHSVQYGVSGRVATHLRNEAMLIGLVHFPKRQDFTLWLYSPKTVGDRQSIKVYSWDFGDNHHTELKTQPDDPQDLGAMSFGTIFVSVDGAKALASAISYIAGLSGKQPKPLGPYAINIENGFMKHPKNAFLNQKNICITAYIVTTPLTDFGQ